MSNLPKDQLLQMKTTCGSLLYELQIIWDEVGESDVERDKLLLELEQECLEVYRRKVDQANRSRAQLRQAIADAEAEPAANCSAMGERPLHLRQSDKSKGSLKEELRVTVPQLEEMRKRKNDRLNLFNEVLDQIQKISKEIVGQGYNNPSNNFVDETDLSTRKLDELQTQLQALQKEKSDRLKQVLDHLNTLSSLCLVLGMDFKHTVGEVHSSLDDTEGSKSISNDTIERLAVEIKRLRDIKIQRMQKLQDLATTMLELWNLMDMPIEEQQMFQNVTCKIAASEHEITKPGTLSVDSINYDDGLAALSAGRRGLDVVGLPVKKHSFNATSACESEAPMTRKAFSPVTALSSKANVANALEELNISHNGAPVKVILYNNLLSTTPSKQTFATDEENRNPKVTPTPAPTTPSTVSVVPMQTATTPAVLFGARVAEIPPRTHKEMPIPVPTTPPMMSVPMQMSMIPALASTPLESTALETPEEREYSFEERRAGFVVPRTRLKPVHV